jgi:hypothetical protein
VTLHAHAGDTFSPTPQVLITGPADVSIVASDCCTIGPDGVVVFSSTDGGATYVGPTQAGDIGGVTTGTVAGGQLVVANNQSPNYQIQAFPPNPPSPAAAAATPDSHIAGDTALATDKNGVLSAQDDLTDTYVYFAAAGANFNASASYHHVATIKNQDTVAASGNAVLTAPGGSITGKDRLWFFNGKSLSGNYKVPDTRLGDDGYFAMKEVRGTVYVFFLGRRNHYDLYEERTRNGRTWTPLEHYASAIKSEDLVPVLNGIGAGLVFEAQSPKPLLAQPIMVPQHVHVKLLRTHVTAGHGTKLTGSATPRLRHQLITLEVERHGHWYRVKTTHESKTGSFSFSVPAATHTYRVVVADKPGLYQFGYSNSVTLTA